MEIGQGAIIWWCSGVLHCGGSEERVRRALSFDLELCRPVDLYEPDVMDILELQKRNNFNTIFDKSQNLLCFDGCSLMQFENNSDSKEVR